MNDFELTVSATYVDPNPPIPTSDSNHWLQPCALVSGSTPSSDFSSTFGSDTVFHTPKARASGQQTQGLESR